VTPLIVPRMVPRGVIVVVPPIIVIPVIVVVIVVVVTWQLAPGTITHIP
jgi:hypothetical protein